MISCTLWGNGYVRIYRDRQLYRPVWFKYYHPAKVTPVLTDNEVLFYRLDNEEMLSASDMIPSENFRSRHRGQKSDCRPRCHSNAVGYAVLSRGNWCASPHVEKGFSS